MKPLEAVGAIKTKAGMFAGLFFVSSKHSATPHKPHSCIISELL
ncbi:MAG TPA: hypothetical protein VJ698_16100 [Noviherbaspirillum sp.]|nr:hypothetical protein [Noviherbaspirillum sp.]HJV86989.1 hypothetical protein [Noviherbaspirillum sp.]